MNSTKIIKFLRVAEGFAFLLVVTMSLYACSGCDEKERTDIWNKYRSDAQTITTKAKKGVITTDQLDARYYIFILSRDMQIAKCECPKMSPSSKDKQQVFADSIDPICILSLTDRYAQLADTAALGGRDSIRVAEELADITNLLTWYGQAVGIGDVQTYDAYANLAPVDTALVNERVRVLSHEFQVARMRPMKVELIGDGEHDARELEALCNDSLTQ